MGRKSSLFPVVIFKTFNYLTCICLWDGSEKGDCEMIIDIKRN